MSNWAVPPSNPIAGKDVAETFAESDVTVSNSNTAASDEQIRLDETVATTTRPSDNDSLVSSENGIEINPNTSIDVIEATISENTSGGDYAWIETTGGTELDSDSYSGEAGEKVRFEALGLTSGTSYYIRAKSSDGSGMTTGRNDNTAEPYSSSSLDIVGYVTSSGATGTGYLPMFNDVKHITNVSSSGSATIEWDQPPDVFGWDTAKFQRELDGETVDVFIEELIDGSWTEIAGPINRGQEISADPDNECRFRVDMDRADTKNIPTLDSIYRRWVV